MPDSAPLTAADLETMKEGLTKLDEADNLIARSIAGGLDMTVQKARSKEARAKIMSLKQAFFPGQ